MTEALKHDSPVELSTIDKFVDGAAVKKVGTLNFEKCRNTLSEMVLVDEGKVCGTILQLYNEFGIVVEPAGALALAALDQFDKDQIKGKNIVLIVSGGNNDITRTNEIRERWMFYEGLKHESKDFRPARGCSVSRVDWVANVCAHTTASPGSGVGRNHG